MRHSMPRGILNKIGKTLFGVVKTRPMKGERAFIRDSNIFCLKSYIDSHKLGSLAESAQPVRIH